MFGITLTRRWTALALAVAVTAAVAIGVFTFNTLAANASTNVTQDPVGDAVSESGSPPPGYLDVKQVRITEKKGKSELEFACTLAAPAPASLGADDYAALCALSLNVAPNGSTEYVVAVRWTNGAYEGVFIDYTAGFPPTQTPIDFSINGSSIKATVPAEWLGNPDTLTWISLSREKGYVAANPFEGVTDIVPDGIAALPWTPGDPLHFENLGVWTSN